MIIHPHGVSYLHFYKEGKQLGSGASSTVYEAINKKTKELWAAKVIRKDSHSNQQEYVRSEIQILSKISHPNIIALKEVFEDEKHFCLILE